MRPLEHYLNGHYEVETFLDEGGPRTWWIARLRAMPGCIAQGDTEEQALARLERIRGSFIRSAHSMGVMPEPDEP